MKYSYKTACIISFSVIILTFTSISAFGSEASGLFNIGNMSHDIVMLIAYVLLALLFSFLCSIAEAVLLSITPSYIEEQKEKNPKRAAHLKRLKQDNVDRSLAAILTLNTIAHTVGAIGAGAKATVVFGSAWFGVFSAVMTLMILFLSEIVPKTIGAIYWPKLVGPTVIFVRTLIVTLFPIVWISERMTKFISHGKNLHIFSRDEFVAMARIGEQSGHIDDNEARIIKNLFRLGSINVTDIMTPRIVITALSDDKSVADASEYIAKIPFSRIPIYEKDIDNITGFVLRDDVLLRDNQERGNELLKTLRREILIVPESVVLTGLLENFLKGRQHIAIVVDEYGGTMGLVTLEDLVETLMGLEIVDEMDTVVDMRVLARKKWEERARALGINSDIDERDPFEKLNVLPNDSAKSDTRE
ncbi:MAG TPA: hemolysin family protein [Smithellaceae bacterium]|mgnify:FL=1|nr:hemolysin family protein [Smithellaceae bacterium]HOQ43654.1 hemolysin family protein [Smithellaceae bacterium]